LHQKCQIQDYQTKDRLSVRGILLLQQKPKLGRTKYSAGPGLEIAAIDPWFSKCASRRPGASF